MIELPVEFLNRMKESLGEEFPGFLHSYEVPPARAIRVNTLKVSVEKFKEISPLTLDGQVPWEKSGFYTASDGLGRTVAHFAGLYYVQEPSAMCAVPELEIKAGERVLDLCSAPGGKGTQIAQYMNGSGVLVLNEIIFDRFKILKSNVERTGVKNALVTCSSPEKLSCYYGEYFDKILVDAPCSGEGMFKKEPNAIPEWSLENVKKCAERQKFILDYADKMLAGGGRIVYSTCTFAPEEDEGQIENFLKSHSNYKLIRMKKLLPHEVRGEGHFCAVLEKTDGGRREDFKTEKQANAFKNTGKEFEEFFRETLLVRPQNICRSGEDIYSLVGGMPEQFNSGVKLGEVKAGRFEPSHAFAMSLKKEEVKTVEVDEATALSYLRGLTFGCPPEEKGWRVVTYLGYPLGWCKAVNGTAKNHLPKGLRI